MSVLVTPPTVEPVTPDEVKLRLKYPRNDQDAAISEWIRAARDAVERYVERGLLTQTWRLSTRRGAAGVSRVVAPGIEATDSHVDWFTHNLTAVRGLRSVDSPASFGFVDLPWAAPVQAVESVTDADGVVDPAGYVLDDTVEPARLYWLSATAPASGVVSVVYRIGYGDTADTVPSVLRNVVHALVAQFFLYRSGPPPQSALDATLRQADGYRVRVLC